MATRTQPAAKPPAPAPLATSRDRNLFLAALALFLVWVVGLAALAVVSARRPEPRRAVAAPATAEPAEPAEGQGP